jgi:hypothetical protein
VRTTTFNFAGKTVQNNFLIINNGKVITTVGTDLILNNVKINDLHAYGGVHTEFIRRYGITFQ